MRLVESSVHTGSGEVSGFDRRGVLQDTWRVLIVLFRYLFFIRVYVWFEGIFRLCCI